MPAMPIRSVNEIEQTIYDKHGNPLAYIAGDGVIYGFDGACIAYVYRSRVWTFPGQQLGWFDRGWLRTLPGRCVGAADNADTLLGPQLAPRKQSRQKLQRRGVRAIGVRRSEPVKPAFQKRWSKAPLSLFLAWLRYDAGQ